MDIITDDPKGFLKQYESKRPHVEILGARYVPAVFERKGPITSFYAMIYDAISPLAVERGVDMVVKYGFMGYAFVDGKLEWAQERNQDFEPDLFPDKCLELELKVMEDTASEKDPVLFQRKDIEMMHKCKEEMYINLQPRDHYDSA